MILEDDEHGWILWNVDDRVVKCETFLVACWRFHELGLATAVTASQHAALEDVLILVPVRHGVNMLRRVAKEVSEVDAFAKCRCYTQTHHSTRPSKKYPVLLAVAGEKWEWRVLKHFHFHFIACVILHNNSYKQQTDVCE